VCHQNTQAPPSSRGNVEWAGADRVPFTVFDPPLGGTGPWVIVATDIFGVTPFYEYIGSLLAEAGYRVAIPDLFHRVGSARDGSREAALERRALLDDLRALADLEAVLEAVAVSGPLGHRYAMMGFCLGGSLALLTAAAHPEQATVTYYAFPRGAPNARVPAPAPIDVAASIQGPVLAHWGREDYIDADEVELLARALSQGTAPNRIVWYEGAGHSFLSGLTEPGRNSAAATDSWRSTIAFLADQVPLQ
jgi:carboxymethylenebutenolidase